jgi:hypothetical protein
MNRKLESLFDGFVSTADLIGTLEGYITKNPHRRGYVADRYGFADAETVIKTAEHNQHLHRLAQSHLMPSQKNKVPYVIVPEIKRTLDEQIIKGCGDVIGLAYSVGTLGIGALWFYVATRCEEIGHKEGNGGPQQHYWIGHQLQDNSCPSK